MDCSTLGLPVHHQLPDLAQTHVHRVSDAIQPSHPLSSPSPPAFNLSQHQGLFHESVLCTRWPEYWSFSFSISPSNESTLRMRWPKYWRSNQSILKEISSECSLEGPMLKLKLQYFGHLMQRTDLCEKTLMLGRIEGRRRRG